MAAVVPAEKDGLCKPKAFVVPREGIGLGGESEREHLRSELQAHVRERLSKHKYPRWVVFVPNLPRNDRGKIDRRTLIEREERGENPWS